MSHRLSRLQQQWQHQPELSWIERGGDLQLDIEHPRLHATLRLQGAQLLHVHPVATAIPLLWSFPATGQNTLYHSGIPLCWPWFGQLSRNAERLQAHFRGDPAQAPVHGLLASLDWQLEQVHSDRQGITLVLSVEIDKHTLPSWPCHVRHRLELRLTDRLQLLWQIDNLDTQALHYGCGLHPYLRVHDRALVEVQPLQDSPFLDARHDWQPHPPAPISATPENLDRVYPTAHGSGYLQDVQRQLRWHSEGFHSAVIWSPNAEDRQRLSLDQAPVQQLLCVEPVNLFEGTVTLLPGHCYRHRYQLWAEPTS